MLFVFLEEGTIFWTSYSSKFEFWVLLHFRTSKDKLVTQPNKEAHQVRKAWSAIEAPKRMPFVVGFTSPSQGVFSQAWARGAQGAKRGTLFKTKIYTHPYLDFAAVVTCHDVHWIFYFVQLITDLLTFPDHCWLWSTALFPVE